MIIWSRHWGVPYKESNSEIKMVKRMLDIIVNSTKK